MLTPADIDAKAVTLWLEHGYRKFQDQWTSARPDHDGDEDATEYRALPLATFTALLDDLAAARRAVEELRKALDAKDVAREVVQSLADSEPDGPACEGMERLKGTDAESYFVIPGDRIREAVEQEIDNRLYDFARTALGAR